jgi:peptidoglycan/LPS O-acetylase OafA/YrhL
VEVQFYLLLPLVFMLLDSVAPRRRPLALFLLALGACAAHLGVLHAVDRVVPWPGGPWLTWVRPHGAVVSHSLLAHLPHFLLGTYLGRWRARAEEKAHAGGSARPGGAEGVFWGASLVVVLLLATDWNEGLTLPGGRYGLPLLPLLIGAVLLAAPATRWARCLLDSAPLRGLGAPSYGIYIYHYPCMTWVDRL